ncbi:hypothetical protein MMC09_006135 [Bachmanniomyces sp. S44760]|nr:hypothetical protein [Bachmanniomyces sp. S44760]
MYHYSVPPPGYVPYHYTTSASTSPSPDEAYDYYVPQYKTSPTANSKSTPKRHSRTASFNTPRAREPAGWHSPAGMPSQTYYSTMPDYSSPPAKHDHVSYNSDRIKSKARRFSMSGNDGAGNGSGNGSTKRRASVRSQTQHIIIDVADEAYLPPTYTIIEPRSKYSMPTANNGRSSSKSPPKKSANANQDFFYTQAPAHVETFDSHATKTRPRRSSNATRPATTPAKPARTVKPPPQATASDAARAGIPSNYSLKNWDPTESPVLLLGSVFDANSLGKWIYDWTVFHHGPATPMSEVAGDLWLLLIKLAGKMKRADECLPRIRNLDSKDMLDDFLDSGDRMWDRLKKLLKTCEEYMWKVAKREGAKGSVKMGKNSGCEFVDTIFGRDRELEKTEKLMTSIRLWNMRFDANCEDILRRPSAP